MSFIAWIVLGLVAGRYVSYSLDHIGFGRLFHRQQAS
jgi:hypothetical protein